MVNQDSARRRTIGQSERGVNLVTRRDLAHEYSYEWLMMMMMWGLKSSDVGLTVTNGVYSHFYQRRASVEAMICHSYF